MAQLREASMPRAFQVRSRVLLETWMQLPAALARQSIVPLAQPYEIAFFASSSPYTAAL